MASNVRASREGASGRAGSSSSSDAVPAAQEPPQLEEELFDSILALSVGLAADARRRLAGILLEASSAHLAKCAPPSALLRCKAQDGKGKEEATADERDQLAGTPGKIPRRRITTTTRMSPFGLLSTASCTGAVGMAQRPAPARSMQQKEPLFLVFRFLDASRLLCAGSVCSVWRNAAADERLWMWLYLGSELSKPSVMPGSWRKDFIQKQRLTNNWLRGRHSATVCEGHLEAITCLSVSGSVVVSGSDDMDLRVWDLREDTREGGSGARCVVRHVHSGHTGKVLCCCIVRGLVVSGSEDKTVRVWDLASGKHLSTLSEHTNAVLCLATDGKCTVYSGGADNTVCMWCVERMVLVNRMKRHTQAVLCMGYSHAIGSVITGSRDHGVGVWRAVRSDSGNTVGGVSGASGGIGAGGKNQHASRTRILEDFRMLEAHGASVICIETDAQMIATGSDDKSVRLWNAVSGVCLRILEPHGGPVSCISIRGQSLLSGSFDGKVRLFDLLSGRCTSCMTGHQNAVLCLAATQRVCITGANDRNLRIWDYHDDKPPPIPASVASYKKDWGMPSARLSACTASRNSCRATVFDGASFLPKRWYGASTSAGAHAASTPAGAHAAEGSVGSHTHNTRHARNSAAAASGDSGGRDSTGMDVVAVVWSNGESDMGGGVELSSASRDRELSSDSDSSVECVFSDEDQVDQNPSSSNYTGGASSHFQGVPWAAKNITTEYAGSNHFVFFFGCDASCGCLLLRLLCVPWWLCPCTLFTCVPDYLHLYLFL